MGIEAKEIPTIEVAVFMGDRRVLETLKYIGWKVKEADSHLALIVGNLELYKTLGITEGILAVGRVRF